MPQVRNPLVTHTRVVGDRDPFEAFLKNQDGTAFNITTTVNFRLVNVDDGSVKINASATVVDGPTGQVRYTPSASDVDTAGTYAAYWIHNTSPSARFPFDGARWLVRIVPESESE